MNNSLLENNYLVLRQFITKERSEKLANEYKKYCFDNNIENDDQALNSHSSYNYISFLELLCEKTPEISKILGETVLPTYTYSRVYKEDSVLEIHKDRDACEISLTLNLDGDRPWPIWIETPNGESKFISLDPGDAMMYLGTIANHWREKFTGKYYTQVFLHYVRSRGDCSYTYFDKEREKNTKSKGNDNKVDEKIESTNHNTNIIESPKINYNIKPNDCLDKFVHVFDDILSEDLCDEIIETLKCSNEWEHASVGTGTIDPNTRNCSILPISNYKDEDVMKKFDDKIFEGVSKVIQKYSEIHPSFSISIDTGYQMLRYDQGQYYIQHVDNYVHHQRSVSCSIQLNDNYDGGEFALFDREMLIRAKKGSAIVFPSNFMFPHEIMPVQKGTRYSIITWLV